MEYSVDRNGDTTITLRRIKIRNIKKWENVKKEDLKESQMAVALQKFTLSILSADREKESEELRRKSTIDWS